MRMNNHIHQLCIQVYGVTHYETTIASLYIGLGLNVYSTHSAKGLDWGQVAIRGTVVFALGYWLARC